MVDAYEAGNRFLSKNRWRAKFSKEDDGTPKPSKAKSSPPKYDDDVDDFLKPSTEKAQAQKEAATAAFLAAANKPKIDVAKAQRWPGASEILDNKGAVGPGIGGMKTGKRKQGLSVAFVRTQPEVIGHGGDECEEPSIEVFNRRKSNSVSDVDKLPQQTHQDDMVVGARSPKFNGMASANTAAAQRGIVTRTLTSHGEMSPPLQQKLETGQINAHAKPPPPPPQGLGPMGLGERPKGLSRAPTGFDTQLDTAGRPSLESSHSNESENQSPAVSMKAPSLPPTTEEEDPNFQPKPIKRSQTGFSDYAGDSDDESVPAVPGVPRLPEVKMAEKEEDPPVDANALLAQRFLESEPPDDASFSARVMHKMRAEEGRALHNAKRDSGSSSSSLQPQHSNPFHVGTPPSTSLPFAGKTPPRMLSREPSHTASLDTDDSHLSRARRPSPGLPGSYPTDTDPRPPSSSSSQYSMPSAASRTRGSPTGPVPPFPSDKQTSVHRAPSHSDKSFAGREPAIHRILSHSDKTFDDRQISVERMTSRSDKIAVSGSSQSSIQVTPPQFEQRSAHFPHPQQDPQAPPPPPHVQDPTLQHTVRSGQESAGPAPPSSSSGLGRSDTKSQAEFAFRDFAERVQHMKGIFELTAQLGGQIYDHGPMEWLRVAIWWFLKGRTGMENLIRSRPKGGEARVERLEQAHVDLAKTWWILTQVVQNHPALSKYGDHRIESQARLAKEAGDSASQDVYETHDTVLHYMKMLMGSIKRNDSMPPTQALIQGQDQSIWEQYPPFTPDVASLLSHHARKALSANPGKIIPVSDTNTDFCYSRMFAKVSIATDDPNTDRVSMPAVISILRPREQFQVKLTICTQTELMNVVVGSNQEAGPTWRDISWKHDKSGFLVHLRHGYVLTVETHEMDRRSLWSIIDHTNRVEGNMRERSDERRCINMTLREAGYKDPATPTIFPAERVRGCTLLVFEKFERSSEGTGKRKLHRGYRAVMITPTKNRTLSCVTHEIGTRQEPLNFEYRTEPDQAPAMVLRFREETPDQKQKTCTMYLVFNDSKERNALFGTFTSMNIGKRELVYEQVPLKSFSIESADPAEGFSQMGGQALRKLQWQEAKTINSDPEAVGMDTAPTVMSESLRILCRHSAGVFSDRMNLGPGDLLVRLPTDGAAELTLLRNPQQDMAIAIDSSRTERDVPHSLAELLRTLINASTIRRLAFNSFKDLHAFQTAITGFHVLFDGIASTFSIARRRMVVPIYKQWTASTIRLQIVQQDNIIQLLAFFEDFSHADAMNFKLTPMDTFEKIEKNKQPCVRMVDAKFALPVEERRGEGKMGKEEGKLTGWAGNKRRFVCLDQIEYPGEHDDILIAFDSAETRDRFAQALPATADVGRKFTVRRKI